MKIFSRNNLKHIKRVVFYHDSYAYGGMELYILRLMRYLDPDRYVPLVMVPGYLDAFRSSPARFIEEVGVAGIPLLRPSDPGSLPGISALKEIGTTAHLLHKHEADLLHIHSCRPEGARKATIAARIANIGGVLRSEHFPPEITTQRLSKYLVKPFDWLTDFIVTGSDGDRQQQIELLERPAAKVHRIYNSVELSKFDPQHNSFQAKSSLGLDPNLPVIGSVGRLTAQKGQRYLIEALPQVIASYGPVNLVLVGDGELRQELEILAQSLSVGKYVIFAGFQSDVLPYMQASDIAVMPSLFEVLSLAMLEFMALGKPMVASDHSSFTEVIRDGVNGFIVPKQDHQALGAVILRLLNDDQLRLAIGRAGMERVRANFSFERLAGEMMDLYDHILSKANHPYSLSNASPKGSKS